MNILLARIYALLIGALALVGLFVNGHLFGFMNTDIVLDIVRVVLAAGLVYIAFIAKSERWATMALLGVGALYVVMGIAGLFAPTLGGMLPTGLTGFDVAFHLVTGVLALGAGARATRGSQAAHA